MKKYFPTRLIFVAAVFALICWSNMTANADTTFTAALDGAQQFSATSSTATGTATIVLNAAEDRIYVSLNFSGLTSNHLAIHIHGGAAGANGPVIFGFSPYTGGTSGTYNRNYALSAAQVTELKAERLYINIHTSQLPDGELRGQILPVCTPPPASLINWYKTEKIIESPSFGDCTNDVAATPTGNPSVTTNSVTVNFANVTAAGNTVATALSPASSGALTTGFAVSPFSTAYDVRTSAAFSGNVEVCFTLPNVNDQSVFNKLRLMHNEGGALINRTTATNFAARRICATVTSLSPFAVAEAASTAALVTVGGRITTADGRGIKNVLVSMTDIAGNTRIVQTSAFGYYRFANVPAGDVYIFGVSAKRFSFGNSIQVRNIAAETDDVNFVADN